MNLRAIKHRLIRPMAAGLLLAGTQMADALTVTQAPGSGLIAFEAEKTSDIVAGTPETWGKEADAAASGGAALVAEGTNDTGTSPHSFAHYHLRFATAGTYYIYYRWRSDPARTGGDVNTANSSWLAKTFGSLSAPGADSQVDYNRTDSNNSTAPANNDYAWRRDLDTFTYTVSENDLTNAAPLVLTLGTREAGMAFDRFILSTDSTLTSAQLDAQANSDTDIVEQGSGQNYVAFEAEGKVTLIAGTPETWAKETDAAASGGAALVAEGTNDTGTSPHSFAQYQLRFSAAGTYYIYYRWRSDPARTGGDVNTANSSWLAKTFGAFSTPGADSQVDYNRTDSNNSTAPANNAYAWRRDLDTFTYTVTESDLTNTAPLILTLGTREAGMAFDRFILSTDSTLTSAQLDATINSGAAVPTPELANAVGSGALTDVTLKFTRPLDTATVSAGDFKLNNGVTVSLAEVNTDDPRIVRLTTSLQTQNVLYTVTVNSVNDNNGTPIRPDSTIRFTSWKQVNGWVTKEIYFGIAGATVQNLLDDPRYQARTPDKLVWVRGFGLDQDPVGGTYGVRLSALFKPSQSGSYNFFLNNDDEAELRISSDDSEANLQSLGVVPLSPRGAFDDNNPLITPALTTGSSYLLTGLLKQDGGDVYLNVVGKLDSDSTPAASLPFLGTGAGASQLSTFVNPDMGTVVFTTQPSGVTAPAGGRARFVVEVKTQTDPVYYQWQVSGQDIPGANRHVFVTPVLKSTDNGKIYRCVISVAGTDTSSSPATLTVGAPTSQTVEPFVGINFVGGGGGSVGASLTSVDVAGVVQQENWNNLDGFAFDGTSMLKDASGADTSVKLTAALTEIWYSGTIKNGDADSALLQGLITAGSSHDPQTLTLSGIPSGTYQVLVYSVGFDFTPAYEQSFSVAGDGTYPTYYGTAQTGLPYINAPVYKRMDSTSAAVRPGGNYVQFDNVKPSVDGNITITVVWDSAGAGNTHQPAINAIQLVKVLPSSALPINITGATKTATSLELVWTGGEGPFLIEGKMDIGASTWTKLLTTADRNASIPLVGPAMFLRIQDKTTDTVKLFRAEMNGANEVPAIVTPGTGRGLLAVNGTQGFYLVSYENLRGAATLSHIHGPAPVGAGANVLIGLNNPSGTSGFITGTITVTAGNLTTIEAGNTYFNIHCAPPGAGGGEIRGQLVK